MPISASDLPGMQSNLSQLSSLKDTSSVLSSATSSITSAVKDPIGAVLAKTMSSINSLIASVSSKITKLEEDIVKSASNSGKVKLVNNVIVVTLEPADASKLPAMQARIQSKVDSLNGVVNKLKVVTATLHTISTSAKILKTAMDAQETLLTLGNPAAKVTLVLIKKSIKILFYKDVLNEYSNILQGQIASTEKSLKGILDKFTGLSVQFIVDSDAMKGVTTTPDQAHSMLRDQSLSVGVGSAPVEFTSDDGRKFLLAVETYGSREIIARARDKFSNLLVAETSPSFISTPDQLIQELQEILNL